MRKNPYQIICENDNVLTYEEMIAFSEEFAKRLKGINCCAILCKSEMAASMALLSCFAAKVTALPLTQRYGELHCNKILDVISPDAIITDQDGDFQIIHISDFKYIKPKVRPALIMCTSGTTGTPKGVMLSEKNIITNMLDISEYFKISSKDYILISRPLYHCAALTGEFLTALIKGTKIRFYSNRFNPPKMLELIKMYDITAFCGTPTLLNLMSKFCRNECDSLRHICISGECLGKELAISIKKTFNKCDIYHIYGLTEASPRVSYLPPRLFEEYSEFVGIPLKNVSIKIINSKGNLCKTNEEGVLWVKGANTMLGYYNMPQKTKETLNKGWLCTGDIALINDIGLLKIQGREDQMIIKGGMNIYPAEIENSLRKDRRVHDVIAFGYEKEYGTQIGIRIVGDFSSVDEVKKICQKILPVYQMPTFIEILKELPKNASGKVVRK